MREASSYNELFCNLAMEEFSSLGIQDIFIAPGSRSTPLTLAAHENSKLTTHVHFDERGLAYYALGCAKQTKKPVVVITTSGTATANLYPAIIEAELTHVPLIICTGDRPFELRNTGANQVIDQVEMFNHTKAFLDLPVPSVHTPIENFLSTLNQAIFKATQIEPGPVHLNWQFQEPLVPPTDTKIKVPSTFSLSTSAEKVHGTSNNFDYDVITKAQNGLVIVGSHAEELPIEKLTAMNWPIIVDVQNNARLFNDKNIISNWDLALELKNDFNPDVVLYFGGPLTSKNGLEFCKKLKSLFVQVHPYTKRLEPHFNSKINVTTDYQIFLKDLPSTKESKDLKEWQNLNQQTQNFLNTEFETNSNLTEPFVAFALSKYLNDLNLFLASSRPIRDFERYGIAQSQNLDIYCNRGASGIDGNLATLAGVALHSEKPTVGFIGDLATLHDLNSLSLIKQSPHSISLFVVNNDGGGIFSFLPVAKVEPFEKYWGTPHGLNFKDFAAGFGLDYLLVETKEQLLHAIQVAKSSNKLFVEIKTTRLENIEYQKNLVIKLKMSN